MDNKLKHLTDKLYQEGVQKGKEAADEILAEANQEAAELVKAAEKKAAEIVAKAEKKAAELKDTTVSDLQMASDQAKERLKSEMISMVSGKVISEPITAAMMDVTFIQKVIETLLQNWSSSSNAMEIRVPEAQFETLQTQLSSAVKDTLENGLTLKPSASLHNGFEIAPSDGAFKMRFTNEDFDAYFMDQLRPKVVELLFDKK
ncbi:hypothetical protein K4L44_08330 [Halosquirtibacter laminarini]|uniref:Uncharacterized protein n=1 Tax=Halosquirtibacter laminarini TaxID=3374600 RepID=A0AC61NJA0_9BACT|nr:hypothetical protein K4L44_08330 [Prolixibacteraceae bacterium]